MILVGKIGRHTFPLLRTFVLVELAIQIFILKVRDLLVLDLRTVIELLKSLEERLMDGGFTLIALLLLKELIVDWI